MKKTTGKRLGLEILQHLIAAGVMMILAVIVFNSHVAVNSMDGTKTYMVNSFDGEKTFENSELFENVFQSAVSDITRLVAIKGQLETDGMFDPSKEIDVTEYADRKGNGNNCPVTAVYELEKLIKWGKYGIEYTNRAMSMSDFVNYFAPACIPANFAFNENGELYFKGFAGTKNRKEAAEGESGIAKNQSPALLKVEHAMMEYTKEQLEDMAFSYIITQIPEGISMFREDDGTLNVYLSLLNCRYETVDSERQLLEYADNWVDYMKLQDNLVETIGSVTENYQLYMDCNGLYLENRSNLKYAVRMMTDEGLRTYTNVSQLQEKSESAITEYFGEYRRYFIYYPDALEFYGNTSLTEDDIYGFMKEYRYAYPDTTHIWIGVDTAYPIAGDAFSNANDVFQKIVPNMDVLIAALVLLAVGWIAIWILLTNTAGISYNEEGEQVSYLNGIDHIWTEFMVVLAAAFAYYAWLQTDSLMELANQVYHNHLEPGSVLKTSAFYRYGIFALYGVLVSLFFDLFWYSAVRRLRCRNLWRDSFLCWLLRKIRRGIRFMFSHVNTALITLLPYNLFLLVNLCGVLGIYSVREKPLPVFLLLAALVTFDGVVGVLMFKNNAERLDIVEGIRRIRDGEVDYKLDTEAVHGTNREMADAVNNIGEGIRKAVKTSMKDEQMKSDLITNVSHDLKTPLTSIINYVDLLKRLDIKEEPAKSYIEVLDNKSQRLKQLTDDLMEVSKISSGNIELQREKLNLAELVNQSLGEFSEKLEGRKLQTVFEGGDLPAYIYADSRRMWRIVENLFNNICKYAMENTRVYLELGLTEQEVILSVKNISERQMNLRGEDLTERFIRGDASRTTEGTGLGLSIAKSLTEVQGGTFAISLDGDLFKVLLTFPQYAEKEEG